MSRVGVVVIGRNEGPRLQRCLRSLSGAGLHVVYVDSGSTDGSVEWARSTGALVVQLPRQPPFTAARARNAGFARLLEVCPGVELVQFVDGDCEVAPGWLDAATAFLESDPRCAVVFGRRRERNRSASVYNLLCDIEWDTPVGPSRSCGGDALMRAEAFRAAGGFTGGLIAGEEPELCLRIRQRGWSIERIDAEMTLHDAAMTRLGQWWLRAVRSGHAYAEVYALHRRGPERLWAKENFSILLSAALVPLAAGLLLLPSGGLSLALVAWYPALTWRSFRANRRRSLSRRDAGLYAVSCVAGKFPNFLGQARYVASRLGRRPSHIIEYKSGSADARPSVRNSPP